MRTVGNGTHLAVARPRTERPAGGWLAAVAVLCFGLGWLTIRATAGTRRSTAAEASSAPTASPGDPSSGRTPSPAKAEETGSSGPRPATASSGQEPLRDRTEADASESTASSRREGPRFSTVPARTQPGEGMGSGASTPDTPPGASAAGRSPPTPPLTSRDVGPRAIQPTRVAYLLCEGLEPRPGPFPCPRDRTLEAQAWAAIRRLPGCELLPEATGTVDLRIELSGDGSPAPSLLERSGYVSDPRIVACLAEAIAQLETTLDADRLVVSFRFRLEPAEDPGLRRTRP